VNETGATSRPGPGRIHVNADAHKGEQARILVVTAEPQIQSLLKSILTADGDQTFFATEPTAAVRTYAAAGPELAILDVGPSDLRSQGKILEMRHGLFASNTRMSYPLFRGPLFAPSH
jgi:PleD family two-component response regulator